MMKRYLVAGASRGIGLAVAEHLAEQEHELLSVSRSRSAVGKWIEADLSQLEGIEKVATIVGDAPLDGLLYMGGTWETHAFTPEYDFATCSDTEIENVLNVNLLAPIRLVKLLLPQLEKAENPKVIFMGSASGRDNYNYREVANAASKFGLRGVVHALHRELHGRRIPVSIINPGTVATPKVIGDLAEANLPPSSTVPLEDLLRVIDCILLSSRSTIIKEVDIPAMAD
jgi:short-subunit dehydrogenase